MKKDYTEYTCDGCMERQHGRNYRVPEDWVSVGVTMKSGSEEIHFCRICWDGCKPPKRNDIPILIRRFFSWTMTGKETPDQEKEG